MRLAGEVKGFQLAMNTPIHAILMLVLAISGWAQTPALTIDQAVQQAVEKYPAIRSSLEQVYAAAAGINLARTAYLPRADFLGQVNRATHNNIFGMVLPQSVISPISGPVLGTNSLSSVWGTAIGGLVSWEPFDFGLRKASVDVAKSVRDQRDAQVSVTKLQVATAAADAFLTILAAQQTVTVAKAGVDRARVLHQTVQTLVDNQLRPGADASRTRSELALAETQVIQAEQAVDVSRAALAQLLGVPYQTLAIQTGPLLKLPSDQQIAASNTAGHPFALAQNLVIEEAKSRQRVLDRSYFPRFYLQGTTYARGTGIQPNGVTGGAASGLGPNVQNWGIGMSVVFSAFDIASIRARKQVEAHKERAESARYDQVLQDLSGQMDRARALLTGAQRIAQTTPIELESARVGELQASARYKAGLSNIVEVAEAQRLLTQAEIDDSLAKLSVWRAVLAINVAAGDLQPFLQQTLK